MVKCQIEGCRVKNAWFGDKGNKTARFCSKHKKSDMINVINKTCEHNECNTLPTFNIKGSGFARFCSKHKELNMVNIKHKKCEHNECNTLPNFNIEGSGFARFCSKHKEVNMINVIDKTCEYGECNAQPAYGNIGQHKSRCSKHKEPNMVDIKHKTCEYNECSTLPTFNIKGSGFARFCSKHKELNMVDIKHKTCEHDKCNVRPTFNTKGSRFARFCSKHKELNMVDIKHKTCEYDKCNVRPTFNIKGNKFARFCSKHKEPNMVNVISKTCEHNGCDVGTSYGRPGQHKSRCAKHREPGMILRPNGKCIVCKDQAIYGLNFIPTHCEIHKLEEERNLVEQMCISCGLIMILDDKGKCEYCNPELFQKSKLAKQNALMDYLDARGLCGSSTDIIVNQGDCGKERPDRVFETLEYVVILECDENQHKNRQCLCEQTRMINIGQGYGGTPVYFIRWNPDNYVPQNDKKNPEILKKRHKLVGDVIDAMLKKKIALPTALISALYMYYDEWDCLEREEWKIILRVDQDNSQ
jgi:hypothetical protein